MLLGGRPIRKVCPWMRFLLLFAFPATEIPHLFAGNRHQRSHPSSLLVLLSDISTLQQRIPDWSHSIVICVFIYVSARRVWIVTFQNCRVTARRYVSHAAQIPCVTSAFLLAAGVGCNALHFRPLMASGISASSAFSCFRCSKDDMHDQVASSAFRLRAFLDRTPSSALPPDRTLDKTAIPCLTLLAYDYRRLGLLATPS